MPRNSEPEDINSEDESDISDADYELTRELSDLITNQGVSEERAQHLWNKQSGLCYITNIPMITSRGKYHYSIEVAPRRITEPISDENSILVCRGVSVMRESLNVTWTQFKAIMSQFTNGFD
tara:strand:+ start:18683 stop:19048 length:366 start_codon:yes stop_codon:yes gene_type:complete